MPIVSAILARNEAGEDRFLRRVLDNAARFADQILVMDDGSTDDTAAVARAAGAVVVSREAETPMWGREAGARQALWAAAAELAGDGWIVVQDADMVLDGADLVRDLAASRLVTAWAWPLMDLWDADHYRVDGYWQGHRHPRCWMFRAKAGDGFTWNSRDIHVGHAPQAPWVVGVAPPEVIWQHYAYSSPVLRARKHQQYLGVADRLTPEERAHADSILDPLR